MAMLSSLSSGGDVPDRLARRADATGGEALRDAVGKARDPESIVLRRVDLEFDLPPDRPWFPSQPSIERILNTFSFMLPPGERFFIDSVREHAHLVSDPVLKEEVRRFIHQEAMHYRQHDAANRHMLRRYERGAFVERLTRRNLAFWGILFGRSARLAGTCAIEHFTASAARSLLRYQDKFEPKMEPAFYRLWMWHAVEESEHKSVCFDVYRTCVGTGMPAYLLRLFIYLLTTAMFLATLSVGMILLGRPPGSRRRRVGLRLVPLMARILPWRQYFAYFRPSFHPADFDCTGEIEKWKTRFPDFDGSAPRA